MEKCCEKCPLVDCRNGKIPSLSWFILCKCYDCIHGLNGPIHEMVQERVKEAVLKERKAREEREDKKLYSDYYNPIKGQFDPENDTDYNEDIQKSQELCPKCGEFTMEYNANVDFHLIICSNCNMEIGAKYKPGSIKGIEYSNKYLKKHNNLNDYQGF